MKKNYDSKRKKTFQDRRTLLLPMKRLFKRLDSSGDRRLNKQEFSRLWRVLEIPEEVAEHTMKNLFKLVDTNRGTFGNDKYKMLLRRIYQQPRIQRGVHRKWTSG